MVFCWLAGWLVISVDRPKFTQPAVPVDSRISANVRQISVITIARPKLTQPALSFDSPISASLRLTDFDSLMSASFLSSSLLLRSQNLHSPVLCQENRNDTHTKLHVPKHENSSHDSRMQASPRVTELPRAKLS